LPVSIKYPTFIQQLYDYRWNVSCGKIASGVHIRIRSRW